jgi:hypothetical protein
MVRKFALTVVTRYPLDSRALKLSTLRNLAIGH